MLVPLFWIQLVYLGLFASLHGEEKFLSFHMFSLNQKEPFDILFLDSKAFWQSWKYELSGSWDASAFRFSAFQKNAKQKAPGVPHCRHGCDQAASKQAVWSPSSWDFDTSCMITWTHREREGTRGRKIFESYHGRRCSNNPRFILALSLIINHHPSGNYITLMPNFTPEFGDHVSRIVKWCCSLLPCCLQIALGADTRVPTFTNWCGNMPCDRLQNPCCTFWKQRQSTSRNHQFRLVGAERALQDAPIDVWLGLFWNPPRPPRLVSNAIWQVLWAFSFGCGLGNLADRQLNEQDYGVGYKSHI